MTVSQADKARKFRARHEAPGCHPRDAGSTRILAGLGFQAARDLERPGEVRFRFLQGVDLGRPSLLMARVVKSGGTARAVHVGGRCVKAMQGSFDLPATDR